MADAPPDPAAPAWHPERPRFRPVRLGIAWLVSAAALLIAATFVPGVAVEGFGGALVVAALVGVLNAVLPPLVAALRLPLTLLLGFVLVLVLDAAILKLASDTVPEAITVDGFGRALGLALATAAVALTLQVVLGTNDDDEYTLHVVRRIARRQGASERTDVPGILFLEVDGLAVPILRQAMRAGSAPEMARWLQDGTHRLAEWETDLSSQTGAAQAGILLGSNEDIPAFRWVEKEAGRLMACSSPGDCAELERRHANGRGLLAGGGTSRGNLLSGEADETILTVSRMGEELRPNPGYRAFLANAHNVRRLVVLCAWEVALEYVAAARQRRRDVRPRGHRGGVYPLMRAALCVGVRDLVVFGVLTDMMRGRPAVYATFAAYDEVAHHSGLERADTLEALRKLDQQFGRIARARRYAPRPYEIVVLSDHGQTQGATFRQRNGYGLDELVERHLEDRHVTGVAGGDETEALVGHALGEATGRAAARAAQTPQGDVGDRDAIVLGSGNLGLVYLMEERRRLTLEELGERHPRLVPALRAHPHVGWLLVRSAGHGPLVLGARGSRNLATGAVEGEDPLAPFPPTAAGHLLRSDGFRNAPDILVGSFYDPVLEEGCAFEELISFHGGLGGPQTRPFLLHPAAFELPAEPIAGAERLHEVLIGWLREPAGRRATAATSAASSASPAATATPPAEGAPARRGV